MYSYYCNVSIGGEGTASGECSVSGYNGSTGNVNDAYYEAFCNATNAGVVISAAAGSDALEAMNILLLIMRLLPTQVMTN